jgi:hypothetical protein
VSAPYKEGELITYRNIVRDFMVTCQVCKQEVKWNSVFFETVQNRFGKGWKLLNPSEKKQALQELKVKKIDIVVNWDNSPHICGVLPPPKPSEGKYEKNPSSRIWDFLWSDHGTP